MNPPDLGSPLLSFAAVVGLVVLVVFVGVKVLRLVSWLLGRVLRFVAAEIRDTVRCLGHLVSTLVLVPLVLLNLLAGNLSRVVHYQKAILAELKGAVLALYRLFFRNTLTLLGLEGAVAEVERRVPEVVRLAPGTDLKGAQRGSFEGYQVLGTLPSGGSGARLYIAQPGPEKYRELALAGFPAVQRVVIKSFSMDGGPSLPQIVRESRALESAKRLGLVLEHGIGERWFYYVMPYVPGDNLSVVVERMHTASGGEGLPTPQLRRGVSFVSDLLLTLERYHAGGLWHKDVKPDNLVVCGDRAYLVDLGLVTPLASAMTLTTHGTEYFRDPELVRLAMKGAKVNEVDGVRFDLYGAGAVLFNVIEGSFPAHGGLSRLTKRCPEALRWIVRRAMAEMHGRYGSAREMLLDVHTVLASADPFALKPADLPSLGGPLPVHLPAEPPPVREFRPDPAAVAAAQAAAPAAEPLHHPQRVAVSAAAAEPSIPRRGGWRVLRGLTMAAAILLLLGACPVLWLGRVHQESTFRHQAQATAIAERFFDGEISAGASSTGTLDVDSRRAHLAVDLSYTRVLGLSPAPHASTPRLLILDDYSSLARPDSMRAVRELLDRLAAAGFQAYGDGTGEVEEIELEVLAGARMAIGLQEPASALDALGAFLAADGGFSGGLWLRQGERADSLECYLVVLGDDGNAAELSRALGLG